MSSFTLVDQARLHTWLPVSVRFSIAPVVAFHNLRESEDVTGHVTTITSLTSRWHVAWCQSKTLMLINLRNDCCLDGSQVIQQ